MDRRREGLYLHRDGRRDILAPVDSIKLNLPFFRIAKSLYLHRIGIDRAFGLHFHPVAQFVFCPDIEQIGFIGKQVGNHRSAGNVLHHGRGDRFGGRAVL